MATFKKKDLNEMVGGDIFSDGGDRNVNNDSEIETGPVQKGYNDNSYFEKGVSPTTDKVVNIYRQDLPWFVQYFNRGKSNAVGTGGGMAESAVITKESIEEIIEDLVNKNTSDNDLTSKDNNPKINKVIKLLKDLNLNDEQIDGVLSSIKDKKSKNI